MRIPEKYQIFPKPVVLSSKDEDRLWPLLSGWPTLHSVLRHTCEPDIQRMILIEMMNRRRAMILTRLVGRLTHVQKNRLQEKIRKAIR